MATGSSKVVGSLAALLALAALARLSVARCRRQTAVEDTSVYGGD